MRIVVASRRRISSATSANVAEPSSKRRMAAGCSRISSRNRDPGSLGATVAASADDTGTTFHKHALDLQLLAQHDDVCREADADPADRRKPKDTCGNLRRSPD